MRTLVVVPTYEEAGNIAELLQRIRAAAPEVDVLVVDDNSPDGTAKLAQALNEELGHIDVLVREEKAGLGTAYRAGFSVGIERGYDVIVQMDADLSHDPSELPRMFAEIDKGADAVIGSRYIPGGSIPNWPWHRRALSKWGNRYTAIVTGMPIKDATSGYRAYRADILKQIDYGTTRAKGYGFQMELAYRVRRSGGTIVEVPITFTDRVKGESKLTLSVAAEELTLVTWWGVRDRVFKRNKSS